MENKTMKISEFQNSRKNFKSTADKIVTSRILKIIKCFNEKDELPSTRQISNVYHLCKNDEQMMKFVEAEIKDTDISLPTNVQDSILQGTLNPLASTKKLEFCYGSRNQKFWKLPDFVLNRKK